MDCQQVVELTERVGDSLVSAAEAVITNHLETDRPVVVEGDYLTPDLLARRDTGPPPVQAESPACSCTGERISVEVRAADH